MDIDGFFSHLEKSILRSRKGICDLLLAAIMGGAVSELTGNGWMFLFVTSFAGLLIIAHDFVAQIVESNKPVIIAPVGYHSTAQPAWKRIVMVAVLLTLFGVFSFSSYKAIQVRFSQPKAADTGGPMWVILDENGHATNDGGTGAADLLMPMLNSVVPGSHGPTLMRIVFTRFVNDPPLISPDNSNPFHYVATRGTGWQNEWDFSFTYQNNLPLDRPWAVRMDIPK